MPSKTRTYRQLPIPRAGFINRRKPYDVDLETVFRAAVDYGKIMELNSNPARLDLDDLACAAAKGQGIPIVISSDSHSVDGFDVLATESCRPAGPV